MVTSNDGVVGCEEDAGSVDAEVEMTTEQQLEGVPEDLQYAVQIYAKPLEPFMKKGSILRRRVREDARKMLEEFAARDPVERMLFEQLLWMHGRISFLHHQCCIEANAKVMEIAQAGFNQMVAAARRHAMALAEYRDPKRRSFTSVKQANIAQQQVVANVTASLANHANNKGGITDASAQNSTLSAAAKKEKALVVRGGKRGIAKADSGE